ncbi:MAG: hypothetical protein EZS28_055899, partial [Streblomastix strix]
RLCNLAYINATLRNLYDEQKADPIDRKIELIRVRLFSALVALIHLYGNEQDSCSIKDFSQSHGPQLQSGSKAGQGNFGDEFYSQGKQYVSLSPISSSQPPGKKQKKSPVSPACLVCRMLHHLLQQNPQSVDAAFQQHAIAAMIRMLSGNAVPCSDFNSTQFSQNSNPQTV